MTAKTFNYDFISNFIDALDSVNIIEEMEKDRTQQEVDYARGGTDGVRNAAESYVFSAYELRKQESMDKFIENFNYDMLQYLIKNWKHINDDQESANQESA